MKKNKIYCVYCGEKNNTMDINCKKCNKKDKIVLEAHTEDYYILNVNYLHNSNEKIKIYVFEKE